MTLTFTERKSFIVWSKTAFYLEKRWYMVIGVASWRLSMANESNRGVTCFH